MTRTIKCENCRRLVPANPRLKKQTHCGDAPCQKARKAKWQRKKMISDPCYRANQLESQETWKENNPGYWSEYRKRNKKYCQRNRQRQKWRDTRRQSDLAKMDTLDGKLDVKTGNYLLLPNDKNLAKMDALEVKIIVKSIN